jgi:GNAT superfamily N-acetyltransferase
MNAGPLPEQTEIRPLGQPGDLGWVVKSHGELYASEYGWDTSIEALVARVVADFAIEPAPDRERAWVAEAGGERVGSVFCVAADARTALLRLLLVDARARGRGLGGRLVDTCLEFARAAGYERIRLWTNHPLLDARRLYLQRGFELVEERAHTEFGPELIGQTYERALGPR